MVQWFAISEISFVPTDDVVAAASLDVEAPQSAKPERPEASHAAGPIRLAGATARGVGIAGPAL
jgi:hypothetical protein